MPYTEDGTGYQNTDTSQDAAHGVENRKRAMHDGIVALLRAAGRPLSAEEIADRIRKPAATVKPRLSELRDLRRVRDSGQRGKTALGRSCILWTFCEQEQAS